MIHVDEWNSQLSAWGHFAEPTALFINKVPDPFMAGDTVDISATKSPGGTELHFSDGTILQYMQSGNLKPALTGVSIWSIPAEGTTIPNNLEYVTIYASYTTKHGKTINAVPAKVPVATPKNLRVIVPEETVIDEGYHLNVLKTWTDSDTGRGINTVVFKGKAYLVVDWEDKNNVIIKTTICDKSKVTVRSVSFSNLGFSSGTLQVVSRNSSSTFIRYRTPEDEGTEITIADSGSIQFSYKINNITLYCETFAEVNGIVDEGLINLRKHYQNNTQYTVNVDENARTVYRDGKVIFGRYAYSGTFYLPIYLVYWDWMGYMIRTTQQTITLKDGEDKDLRTYYRERYGYGNTTWQAARDYHYKCTDGEVEWTEGAIYYWPT